MASRRAVVGGLLGSAAGLVSPAVVLAKPPQRTWVSHEAVSGSDPSGHFYFGAKDGQPQGWSGHNAGKPYSCQTSGDGKLLRLELRAGDQWVYDVSASPAAERTMVQAGFAKSDVLPLSSEVWWGFSFFVEPGPQISAPQPGYDWVIFADIHSEYTTTQAKAVPIQFELRAGDILCVQTHGDFFPEGWHFAYRSPAPLIRGRWHDMVVHVCMDPTYKSGRGGGEAWLDGQNIVSYSGPLGFSGDLPYAQFQVYRSNPDPKSVAHETVAVRFANHEILTNGNLARRIRRPGRIPRDWAL
jgi:hypothetical protein